jgi:hypothetical protein
VEDTVVFFGCWIPAPPYFLCLKTKKVTKKIQGQTICSAGLAGPTHMNSLYTLRLSFLSNWQDEEFASSHV